MSATISSPSAMRLEMSARLIIEAWICAYGVSFSGAALALMHTMINSGVQRMVDEGHDSDHLRIFEAESSLTKFLFQLTQDAKAGYYSEIEQHHVEDTQSSFCPVYPFS